MPHIIRRAVPRTIDIPHSIGSIPVDAEPVAFLNRGGEPTVFFHTASDPKPGAKLKDGDLTKYKTATAFLTTGEGIAPKAAIYIGTAEFSQGQAIFHCWMLP